MPSSQHPTDKLTIHPALQAVPIPAEADPISRGIVASVADIGIKESLKVNKGRVVDGRQRLRAAFAVGLATVPIQEVDDGEVASVILQSLLARGHFTKSALAYLGFPILESALSESRKRRLKNLQIGKSTESKNSLSTEWTIGNTAEELAASLGVSRSLFFMAREIHKKFNSGPKLLRNEWEPKILSGEMGLGEVQQALAGKLAALAGDTHPKGDPQQLLFDLFGAAKVRFGRWGVLTPAQRKAASDKFRTDFLPSLPDDLLEIAVEFLSARAA